MFCSTKLIMWTRQAYYIAMGLHESWYGALMAVGFLLGGASSQCGHLLDGKVGTFRALFYAWAHGDAGLHRRGRAPRPGSGVGLLMVGGTCVYGMAAPRVSEAINRHVSSGPARDDPLDAEPAASSLLFIPPQPLRDGHGVGRAFGVQAGLTMLAAWLCASRPEPRAVGRAETASPEAGLKSPSPPPRFAGEGTFVFGVFFGVVFRELPTQFLHEKWLIMTLIFAIILNIYDFSRHIVFIMSEKVLLYGNNFHIF